MIESGRLGPGEMLSVNLNEGILRLNDEIKFNIASKRPYNLWIEKSIADLKRLPTFNRDIEIFTNNYQVNATPDDPGKYRIAYINTHFMSYFCFKLTHRPLDQWPLSWIIQI